MKHHDFTYSTNRLLKRANGLYVDGLKDYILNLDTWLSSFEYMEDDLKEHIENTIEIIESMLDEIEDLSDI